MRILSPLDNAAEVASLAEAGADEVYGGFIPADWVKRYSLLGSANHRYFANAQLGSLAELKATVKAAHASGMKFHLTMNAPSYSTEQYDGLLHLASKMRGLGVDALIVADTGLMLRLRETLPDMPLHLSTLAPVFNSRTARVYARLGVTRQVLPRELTIEETRRIVRTNPDCEFDVFVMVGKCPNVEGFCSFTHNNPSLVWPCEETYDVEPVRAGARYAEIAHAASGWSRVNRRQACGLCAVPGLLDAGVRGLKLVGRGGPTVMKASVIRATRSALELAQSGLRGEEFAKRAHALYRDVFGVSCNPFVCYFPPDSIGR